MSNQNDPLSPAQVGAAILNGLKALTTTIIALATVIGFGWVIARPHLDDYLSNQLSPLQAQVEKIVAGQEKIAQALERLSIPPPFLEFFGSPQIAEIGPFHPGDTVPFLYFLQRNTDCPSVVSARFYSVQRGGLDTTVTYSFEATRAPVTLTPNTIVIQVRIPEEIAPGLWSYFPQITPRDCGSAAAVTAPPSPFFEVVRK